MEIVHNSWFDDSNPVNIHKVTVISHDKREIVAVIKKGDHIVQVNDIIESMYIGRNHFAHKWIVTEIKERFTPKGHFIIDPENIGLIAVVEPYKELPTDESN